MFGRHKKNENSPNLQIWGSELFVTDRHRGQFMVNIRLRYRYTITWFVGSISCSDQEAELWVSSATSQCGASLVDVKKVEVEILNGYKTLKNVTKI